MAKATVFTKRVEAWSVDRTTAPKTILKVTVRDQNGRFHGSTNFATKAKVGRNTLA